MLGKKELEKILREEMSQPPEISQLTPKTIWVNGCFDVIHAGHIEMIKYASALGQRLVVGLDTDERVRNSKGPSRPINILRNRISVMESIKYVDKVVTFGTDEELIQQIVENNADIIVVGEEYKGRVIGADKVKTVTYFPRLFDLSTTNITSK